MGKWMPDRIRSQKLRILCIGIILFLIVAVDGTVYLTGGTGFAFTHLMYIPIMMAAFLFGVPGSLLTALAGGLSLGPLMPQNVFEGMAQPPSSWMFRLTFFLFIGVGVGFLFQRIQLDKEIQLRQSYTNAVTGYPNATKLKQDMERLTRKKKSFSLIVFQIVNLNLINRYVDYSVGERSLLEAIDRLAGIVGQSRIYSVFTDEFVVLLENCTTRDACLKAKEFADYFKEPVRIDGLPVNLVIKGGVCTCPLHGMQCDELFKKMERTLDQEEPDNNHISVYDDAVSIKNRAKYEVVVAMYDALRNDRFSLVYQPIVNVRSGRTECVEALLRWQNKWNMNPGEFIKVAEDAGIICEITRWVIRQAIHQLRQWRDSGLEVRVAVNISPLDLKGGYVVDYTRRCLAEFGVEPAWLELELTERVLVGNEAEGRYLLSRIKAAGIRVSLDDFGTGYNSLAQLITMPIDTLKIDKAFVDTLSRRPNRFLVEGIVRSAHALGMEVIAEGVETADQLAILRGIGCDHVQGYYLSQPLAPEAVEDFLPESVAEPAAVAGAFTAGIGEA